MSTLRSVGYIGAGVVAGAVLAGTLAASAAGSGTTTTTTASPSYQAPFAAGPGPSSFGSARVRGDETTPSSSIVDTLTKKAEARVSGGTVYRIETDAGDAAYEAHMKKADGTLVTVKFDKRLDITAVEAGMGKGDPRPAGAPAPRTPSGSA